MMPSRERTPPIEPDPNYKVIDVHKMYSDRATAIRQIMLTLVAVTTAGVSAIIALRKDLNAAVMVVMIIYSLMTFGLATYLKFAVTKIVKEYETRVTTQVIFDYGLLPIDALGGMKGSANELEPDGIDRLTTIILVALSIICSAMLIWGLARVIFSV